jgi:Helix-turn-helix domain
VPTQKKKRPVPAAHSADPAPAEPRGNWPGFTKRFGDTVRDAGVTAVPRVLLNSMGDLGLKPIHLTVLLQFISCWGNNGPYPFPTRKRLLEWIGCDKRTLDGAIADLVEMKLIEKRKRTTRARGQISNEYDLTGLIDRLAPLARRAITRKKRREEMRRLADSAFE